MDLRTIGLPCPFSIILADSGSAAPRRRDLPEMVHNWLGVSPVPPLPLSQSVSRPPTFVSFPLFDYRTL